MNVEERLRYTLDGLKDFQLKTVEAAVEQLNNGQSRYLIADEVGLGKTIVAKGIIAKLVQQNLPKKRMLKVVYICSNQILAKENLKKLSYVKFVKEDAEEYNKVIQHSIHDDRITSLAYAPSSEKNKFLLTIRAFTPGTSFDNGNLGRADERVLIYRLLTHFPEYKYRHIALKWFLKGGKSVNQWREDIAAIKVSPIKSRQTVLKIRKGIYNKFQKELSQPLDPAKFKRLFKNNQYSPKESFWSILLKIIEPNKKERSFVKVGANEVHKDFGPDHFQLIAELRFRLSKACTEYLKADLFVLDEFQRYNNLIQDVRAEVDPGTLIAKAIFSQPGAQVVMLSATPFKAYTTQFEESLGENHYQEFKNVLQFLLKDKNEVFWKGLDADNLSYFNLLKSFDSKNVTELKKIKDRIEKNYRQCIARTERTLVELFDDQYVDDAIRKLKVTPADVIDFLLTDEIVKALEGDENNRLPIPTEYVKSSPFPFSFLKDYEHMRVLETAYRDNKEIRASVQNAKRAWLPIRNIEDYKPLLPASAAQNDTEPNAKLRLLYNETVRKHGWQLLWLNPSLPYYEPFGAYKGSEGFSKTLIFSAWKMVPRMISGLVSYEAERLSIGGYDSRTQSVERPYFQKTRTPLPQLTFQLDDGKASKMNNQLLTLPSVYLAKLYNPADNILAQKPIKQIRQELAKQIKRDIVSSGIASLGRKGADSKKWDWYALLLLEREEYKFDDKLKTWLTSFDEVMTANYEEEDEKRENGSDGKKGHFERFKRFLLGEEEENIGILTDDRLEKICLQLADQVLGNPATCAYRSFSQVFDAPLDKLLGAAFMVGQGFLTLYNKPECVAIINQFEKKGFYHDKALSYGISGNIQAMLDEFVYQLKDSGGMEDVSKCAGFIYDVLTVPTSYIEAKYVDSKSKIISDLKLRTHYALPFGVKTASDTKSEKRQIKVREAFNSPFRPFVLTSTSIGQEGLDFHYYCNKLIHWNLPTNPIDIEQREGRIKRYKGLNIRRALAQKYRVELKQFSGKISAWQELFEIAERQKPKNTCDLVPFWVLPEMPESKIQAIIPIYQYSKDDEKLKYIKKVLGNYRLTFGQPRQEELLFALSELLNDGDAKKLLKELVINLAPIDFLGS